MAAVRFGFIKTMRGIMGKEIYAISYCKGENISFFHIFNAWGNSFAMNVRSHSPDPEVV